MKISIAAKTDVGRGRENNEDAFAFCTDVINPDWHHDHTKGYVPLGAAGALLIVADGMGGANAGEVASAITIDTVKEMFADKSADDLALTDEKAAELLSKAVRQADKAILQRMCDDPDTAGMGTTVVICWVTDEKAYIAWCGDSRCYSYSTADGLQALTKDHSYVQELIDKGEITEAEAFNHPDNNIITRGLGEFETEAKADVHICPVSAGNTFLLCSDGLCGYCTNEQIAQVLEAGHKDTNGCAKQLLDMALDVPGDDNICLIVATLLGDDDDEDDGQPSKFVQFFKNMFGA
jgi:protein phosphatase